MKLVISIYNYSARGHVEMEYLGQFQRQDTDRGRDIV